MQLEQIAERLSHFRREYELLQKTFTQQMSVLGKTIDSLREENVALKGEITDLKKQIRSLEKRFKDAPSAD